MNNKTHIMKGSVDNAFGFLICKDMFGGWTYTCDGKDYYTSNQRDITITFLKWFISIIYYEHGK